MLYQLASVVAAVEADIVIVVNCKKDLKQRQNEGKIKVLYLQSVVGMLCKEEEVKLSAKFTYVQR